MARKHSMRWSCSLLVLWLCACDAVASDDPGAPADGGGGNSGSGQSGDGGKGGDEPADEAKLPLDGDRIDVSGGAWRFIEAPASGDSLARTPDGWLALVSRTFGGKVITRADNALYRSQDGVRWEQIPVTAGGQLELRSLAYGNGRYVMVGRHDGKPVIWTSSDAEQWDEAPQELDSSMAWGSVAFVGGRFFALGFRVLGVSEDGLRWQRVMIDVVQVFGIAHGGGRYMITGSGGVITSSDGLSWKTHTVDCALPDNCVTDPSGGVHAVLTSSLLFAEGAFFTGRLRSTDGASWSIASQLPVDGYSSGQFLSLQGDALGAWQAGARVQDVALVRPYEVAVTAAGRALNAIGALDRDAPLPASIDAGFEDGLTCKTAQCLRVGGRLLLVPPPGTPALPDRVPRNAEGAPLLSDDCPVSTMLFCADYEARRSCTCRSDAPRAPEACDDVSQFTCLGRFTPRAEEWDVPEVGAGGCSCDGHDPNQPAGFGLSCEEGDDTCEPPFACLPIVRESSDFPSPQEHMCTAACSRDSDCPSWEASGFCAGTVALRCAQGACQRRSCD